MSVPFSLHRHDRVSQRVEISSHFFGLHLLDFSLFDLFSHSYQLAIEVISHHFLLVEGVIRVVELCHHVSQLDAVLLFDLLFSGQLFFLSLNEGLTIRFLQLLLPVSDLSVLCVEQPLVPRFLTLHLVLQGVMHFLDGAEFG